MDQSRDLEHLRILSIFHYVVGGLTALFASFPIIHLAIGIFLIVAPEKIESGGEPPLEVVGWLFTLVGGAFVIIGWAIALCIIVVGRFLARRRHYLFCLIIAGVECIFMPFGTVLGIFTIIVLSRESVKEMFAEAKSQQTDNV
jgi:hypothetical protein